jgi:hypothetical protein
MKRITLFLSFSFACLLGACASEKDVTCEVVWSANDQELGRATIVYEGLDDVDAGLDACLEDQADHQSRPMDATMHACNCST